MVLMQKLAPIVHSMDSPATIITALSKNPKPTKGSPEYKQCKRTNSF
uniref:Uncharacterized protein n=1 Tax=Lepeophtheirus salmonis TaxID=72036 RepID=A0A0K2V0N5_LEPSM